ncbi:MAG: hypothetical protein LR006_03410 [Dehalococcoidia bacterium]|nr:hypothetical protein [Dehalococcoidia bacterium]
MRQLGRLTGNPGIRLCVFWHASSPVATWRASETPRQKTTAISEIVEKSEKIPTR